MLRGNHAPVYVKSLSRESNLSKTGLPPEDSLVDKRFGAHLGCENVIRNCGHRSAFYHEVIENLMNEIGNAASAGLRQQRSVTRL